MWTMRDVRQGQGVRSLVTRLLGRAGQAEVLEQRQMLAADLPQGAEWSDWGNARIAHERGSYVVTFEDYMGRDNAQLFAQDVAAQLGLSVVSARGIGSGLFAEITFNRSITFAEAQSIQGRIPTVKAIEPNAFYDISRVPNDPEYDGQWSLENAGQIIGGVPGTPGADIGAQEAWDVTIGERSVVVGIIDTGVDMQHPDLINNFYINPGEIAGNGIDDDGNGYTDDVTGFDFGELDNNPDDDQGHGTHVAGTVAAVGNNGIGIAGIAWNSSILPLKIADRFGRLSTAAIVGAHDYARNLILSGVNLAATNNSYGLIAGDFYEDQPTGFNAERDAIQRYIDAGGIFIAAAGNNAIDNDLPNARSYPASYNIPGVISVAATDSNDGLANFSNFGVSTVDIAAPGVNILSTLPTEAGGPYGLLSGTSMASPTVAGVVALIRSVKPTASAVEVRELLINSSDLLPSLQGKVRSGGRVNVARALAQLNVEGPVVRTFDPGPVTTQLNAVTNQPLSTLGITFSENLDDTAPGFGSSAVTVRGNGIDNVFGTADDLVVPITSLLLDGSSDSRVNIQLNLTNSALFPGGRLPVDSYRVTLAASAFRDIEGNRLNGTTAGGVNENLDFRVVALSGDNEPNDAMDEATPVSFDATGSANFGGASIGNGAFGNRDVDLYQVTLPRGGQITAEVTAQRLVAGSTLDSVVRLFDAAGNQLAANDQFFGNDSYLDFFVNTGGTYYIGVSGFGNAGYNPAVAGSGSTQSTGNYALRISAQLNQDDIVTYTAAANSLPGQPAFPLNIPRGGEPNPPDATQGTTTAGIVVSDTRQVLDINVKINIQHGVTSDLQISLIAPDNREVVLFNRRGGTGDDLGTRNGSGTPLTYTIFDDEAGTAISAASAPFSGSFRPDSGLGLFDGLDGAGTWTIRVVDAQAGDAGRLIDWQLVFTFQNDIFGPFESNDTITTADIVNEFTGTGSATRDAFLGDGGFGSLDRDLYRFTVASGSALTATVTPTGTLDSALRLFDSAGTQIILSNPGGTQSSSINGYVFANGGTYYLAVSETSNVSYDPNAVATGVVAPTTGNYSLSINVAPGVTDPAGALVGNNVTLGYSVDGLYSGSQNRRLVYQNVEMIGSAPRSMFIGASAGPVSFVNEAPGSNTQLPFSVIDQSDQFNNRVLAKASLEGLSIERTMSFGDSDSFIAIDVRLTNTTASTLAGVYWMEGFNPDPGLSLNEGTRATVNDVDATGKIASATYTHNQFLNGLRIALVAPTGDSRALATIVPASTAVRDAEQFAQLPANDPNSGPATDSKLALAYTLGDLTAGASVTMRYFIFLATSQAELDARVTALNTGTAGGHLAVDPSDVALDTLSNGDTVQQYPYRLYYPEGFNGPNIFNFIPMSNPNVEDAHVVIIQHFEGVDTNLRDRVVDRVTIEGLRRRGVDVNLPAFYANGQFPPNNSNPNPQAMPEALRNKPYALEIRSDRPIAATFSYYDLTQIASGPIAVGESFTPEVNTTWTFAAVDKNGNDTDASDDINSYLVFFNPTNGEAKATIRAFNTETGQRFRTSRTIQFNGRSGAFMSDFFWDDESTTTEEALFLPNGQYGVVVTSTLPIVASKTTYNASGREATGTVGNVGLGATRGIVAEGQFGLRNASETIGVLNANAAAAQVTFSFVFTNGSTYRTLLDVPANSHRALNVADLPNFTTGQSYSVYYESSQAVSISSTVPLVEGVFSDALSVTSATRAYSYWGFGEGFRPGDSVDWNGGVPGIQAHPGLTENIRIYNPTSSDIIVEITMNFDNQPGTETFRRTIPARRMQEFNVDQFVTGDRRATNQSYGIFIKAPVPVVAEMNHYDRLFPGAFATLGTPLGVTSSIT